MSISRATRCISLNTFMKTVRERPMTMRSVTSAITPTCPIDRGDEGKPLQKPFDSIPGPRGIYKLPIVGLLFHMKPFGKFTPESINLLFDEMIKRHGSIFRIRLNGPVVVISDPKDFETMWRHEGRYPWRPNFEIFDVYYKRTGKPPNVECLHGSDWWEVRAPIQRMLMRPKQISQYLPVMNEVADDFIQMLTQGGMENHTTDEMCEVYMAESAGTALFNRRIGFFDAVQSEETNKLRNSAHDVFEMMYTTTVGSSVAYKFFKSKDYRKFESALNYLKGMSSKFVKEAKYEYDQKMKLGVGVSDEPNNMLQSLLKEMPVERVSQIMEGLYYAAIDSAAAGLQIMLHTLAKHPDKQEKLRQEIYSVLGNDNIVRKEHLDNMPYLKACLKEVYRHSSIISFGPFRVLPVNVVLGGYNVPAGVPIYIYNQKTCHDEDVFENPNKYEPERWLRQNRHQENSARVSDSWAILPFGQGPRGCPGRRLFEQELFLAVIKLLQKMRIELAPESVDTEFEYRLFRKPVRQLKFTFTKVEMKNRLQ